MKRREFILKTGAATSAVLTIPYILKANTGNINYISKRPPLEKRKFTSKVIENVIVKTKKLINDKELAWMFENCFPNTLDTTVDYKMIDGVPDTFVITGDIHAMWLRDSTAQVWPYLPFIDKDHELQNLILGVINRQSKCINIDPYANAFNKDASGSEWENDLTEMKPELHERKWEIDSLCYPVRLAYHYWKKTNDLTFYTKDFKDAMKKILITFKEQQRKNNKGPYSFMRVTEKATDTSPGKGFGNPIKPVGLICSAFRPSDDATIYSFLIPSNYFAVVSLRQMAEMSLKIKNDNQFTVSCQDLAKEVEDALKKYAFAEHLNYGNILTYEVDGFGNQLFMDDANVPSLLSLPYLGCMSYTEPLYLNTRNFILSENNPWYFKGKAGSGIGGPHVGEDLIWPLSIIMQAMTSNNEEEIRSCLKMLKATHAGTGFMHETFHKDNPDIYTRSWFAWANTLFGELVLKIVRDYPYILNTL